MSDIDTRLYMVVKNFIKEGIEKTSWAEHKRVPSENQLVETCGVSRMTARRALDELTEEGVLYRVQGRGTFVAPKKLHSPMLEIRNIADEVSKRGNTYSNELILLQKEHCPTHLLNRFELEEGEDIYHSIMVHKENDKPIQIEQRYVNPKAAPDYLKQNFNQMTPNVYLSEVAPLTQAEHQIEAKEADPFMRVTLKLQDNEPVLSIDRITWSKDLLVSYCQLFHPASRFKLTGSFTTEHQLTEL
ncbi:histidine utilization repressor [Kangiella sediminilitoris]|uniref:Histidine utilization repressor n=1 Tax=Kangiella sediminilitoris TaxID=1144748 RepID=A0A1B3BA79_9GAMM|nr:histidine utilization repressor [Kangiella sediminilitoris]AOE49678.1 Transcriptional regulator, histidine utilization repressor, GntR family [Kangiella sediminilitoris]